MIAKPKKPKWGGKRVGSGRPKGYETVVMRVPAALRREIEKLVDEWLKSRP